jgi:endo-1,4-beta-xylanase
MKPTIHLRRGAALFALVATALAFTACAPTPRQMADKRGITFGVAVQTGEVLNPETAKFIVKNFNTIVPGDTAKWVNIHPKKDFWNFSDTDLMVAFAEKNHMKIKAHCFVWQDQNAPYVFSAKTRDAAIAILDDHITGIMTRYKGKITEYDVANEIFNENGTMRDTFWLRTIGPDYIDVAFTIAHKADPDAKLLLVDYNTEYAGTAKGDAMYAMAKSMKERGIPISGVAHQLHCVGELPFNETALRENIKRMKELGLYTSFSEVDVRIRTPVTEQTEAMQCDVYSKLMNVACTEPGAGSMLLWGFTDKTSWIPRTFPGYGSATILDVKMQPKKAYSALMNALKDAGKARD